MITKIISKPSDPLSLNFAPKHVSTDKNIFGVNYSHEEVKSALYTTCLTNFGFYLKQVLSLISPISNCHYKNCQGDYLIRLN